MSGIWQELTATDPVPFQIMGRKEATATKTETGISQSGSIGCRIKKDVPGATNTAEPETRGDVTDPVTFFIICE